MLAALNIVLSTHPSRNGVTIGRNRFFFPNETFPLGGGLEAWKGFYSSARTTYKQLMVNVNVATTAFYVEGNLANAMMEFRNATFGARIDTFVRGVRVVTTHLGHKKTVKRSSTWTARTHKFEWEDEGREVSVEEYFHRSKSNSRVCLSSSCVKSRHRIWDYFAVPGHASRQHWWRYQAESRTG